MDANRINIVDIDNELQTFSSVQVLAKVRAKGGSCRQMVLNRIVEYIEEQFVHSVDLTRAIIYLPTLSDLNESMTRTDYGKLEIYCATVFVQKEYSEYLFTRDIINSKKRQNASKSSCNERLSKSDGDSLGPVFRTIPSVSEKRNLHRNSSK